MEQPSEGVFLRVKYGVAGREEGDRRDAPEQDAFGCRADEPGDMGAVTVLPAERIGQVCACEDCG